MQPYRPNNNPYTSTHPWQQQPSTAESIMHTGPFAAVALRNATIEMKRDKQPLRHLKSTKTIRMSFASTRSLAVGSVRALYDAAMTKVDRFLRKDRFKNECRYCDLDMDAQGADTRHELVNVENETVPGLAGPPGPAGEDIELTDLPPEDQVSLTGRAAQRRRSHVAVDDSDDSGGARSRSASST